jgi:N-methylhydantoinase B
MDPVTVAVVRGALEQVADELDMHLIRAAISPVISEMNDCANGLFHPETGETIAQGQYGLPVFLANMQLTVQRLIGLVRDQGGFRPGDVWIVNDPYFSGTHLPDVCLITPYFADGDLSALFATTGHWSDIGGVVPGGWAPQATEIYQEGVFIPPVKLYDEGRRNDALIATILANLRLPHDVGGDLAAMVNVGHVGRRRMDALLARFGRATVTACVDEMMARSEAQMRSHIAELPQGVVEFEDFLDNDGLIDRPIRFCLKITATGSDLVFDFTGTDPCAKGPLNLVRTTTISSCYVALKHVFPEIPVNGGTFRPTRFIIPDGCALAAEHPTPVGGYLEMVGVVIDLVFGALVQLLPGRVPAPFYGTSGIHALGGRHPETGRYFATAWPYAGGYGGSAASDGLVHGVSPQSMATLMSFELCEHRFPIRLEEVALREDSGGPGWHRGGCGTRMRITALTETHFSVLGDRVDHRPFGVRGGLPGAGNRVVFHTGDRDWVPPMRSKYQDLVLQPGDSVELSSPGGGGFGDPLTRPLDDVEADLVRGTVSPESAERDYGVVVVADGERAGRQRWRLDREASRARREAEPSPRTDDMMEKSK